jgi:hypothetical protein
VRLRHRDRPIGMGRQLGHVSTRGRCLWHDRWLNRTGHCPRGNRMLDICLFWEKLAHFYSNGTVVCLNHLPHLPPWQQATPDTEMRGRAAQQICRLSLWRSTQSWHAKPGYPHIPQATIAIPHGRRP